MLKSFVLIAWRTFNKNRLLTLINILGLSIGITAALIVYLVIDYNFSFDRYEPGRDRIYRIVTEKSASQNYGVPAPLHQDLTNITGITDAAPIFDFYAGNTKVDIPGQTGQPKRSLKNQDGIVFTDAGYFRVFPHQWLAGDVQNPLHRPNEVVLTQSRAETWFPGLPLTAVIGRTVILSDSVQATVSGIVKDLDANSDFEYQTFLSLATIPFSSLKNNYNWNKWSATSSAYQLLVKLTAGEKPGNINQQLARLTAAHLTGKDDPHTVHRLQPLADIHTNTDFSGKVSKAALGSLAMLALFLILLGCINFINLAIAQGTQRAKEIGIRKTFGSSKKELIVQFLLEAFLLTTITSFVALTAISLGIRYFIPAEGHTQSPLQLPSLIGFFVCLIIALTFLSGLYPAFILSGYQPVRVLKNQPSAASSLSRSFSLRKTLIIAQFTIAQIFLIGVFVVNKQVHYAIEKDMGFRQNAIVNIHLPSSGPDAVVKRNLFRDQLKKFPSIGKFSLGNESPAINGQIANKVTYNKNDKEIQLSTDIRTGDAGYLDVYEIHVLAGRNLVTTDSANELLINETLARQMGFAEPADAVGQFLSLNDQTLPIVGVMADFNQASVRSSIRPLVFYSAALSDRTMHIALYPDHHTWQKALAGIQLAWKEVYPDEDFSYTFVDENIARFYKQDTALSALLSFAAGIATLVSCIGLLGLAIFSINSRKKEIGIRKVLGASLVRILRSLSAGFVRPLLLALAIATPLAWLACHAYLQQFAFHTTLSWWIFAISGLMMILIAFATIGFNTMKAALSNPVDSLRTE